ncbi:MAG: SPFH domain-containing protein [Halobacteriaceae archaeon]
MGSAQGSTGTRRASKWRVPFAAGVTFLVALWSLDFITVWELVGFFALAVVIVTIYSSVEIVNAYEKRALTVFGEYKRLVAPGLAFIPPYVSETRIFDMRTQTIDVPTQQAITRDNSPVTADAVVYIRVMDAEKAFLEVDDHVRATSLLAQTTLRAVIGDMELDDTLNRRQEINARIREELDEPTDDWGVRVESVEVRQVNPSPGVVDAMEEQTSAERRRRAMILEAQGERQSAIERAQGEKGADVIEAQGEKQSQILEAQGDAISTVLRARAAEAMGERAIIDKGLETLGDIGQSPSTTFVIPQELSTLLGRYGKHLSGSDVRGSDLDLEGRSFDAETRELLGLDEIAELIGEIDLEAEEGVSRADGELADIEIEEPGDRS